MNSERTHYTIATLYNPDRAFERGERWSNMVAGYLAYAYQPEPTLWQRIKRLMRWPLAVEGGGELENVFGISRGSKS